ncbi:hypothetical protein [Oceanobacillus timonensis]|uniref:hypothetical protein n=1 Tax=Oceanobacillus timonensis TaxID=1926285 RepID=UPI0009BBEA64|nr:hypothetical protein [Oceanobacillus timonensis]
MKWKKSYFTAPSIALLLILGACQGASQAQPDTSQQESDDAEIVSETDDSKDTEEESTETNQEDAATESERNHNEDQQAKSDDSNNTDTAVEKESTDNKETSNRNIEETEYSSEQEAVNAIENYEEVEQTNTDLGHGIEALSEGAAGHHYISWNEGNWLIRIDAPTNPDNATGNDEDGEALARTVADYLESNYLPAPDQRGVIEVNDFEDHPGTVIRWQQGNTVYEMDENTDDPIDALQIAVDSAS